MRASHEGKFLASTKREPSFISKGFTYWKERTTAFKKHQASDCHREATEALVELPKQIRGSIEEIMSSEVKQEKALNRRVFLIILENILFLSRQGLALRGHEDSESNFHQLLLLRGNDIKPITEWLKKRSNKYTSHEIQNECLQILSLHILRDLSKWICNF